MRRLLVDRYSGNPPTKYNGQPINFVRLAKDYGFVGQVDKVSMQQSEDLWQWHAAEADLADAIMQVTGRRWLRGTYHWTDPIGNYVGQAEHFLRAIDALNPDFIAFDIEQYRSSWSSVWTVMSPAKIFAGVTTVVEYVLARTNKPMLPYSAKWYLGKYCPELVNYFGDVPAWVASYFDYGQKVRNVTRQQFVDFTEAVAADPMPTTGVGVLRNPIIRQMTSTQILPICRPFNFDYNLILDDAKWDAWLG